MILTASRAKPRQSDLFPAAPEPITQTPVPYSELSAALAAFADAGHAIYGIRHDHGHWVLSHGPMTAAPEWPAASTGTPTWLKKIVRDFLFPTR